MTLPSYTVLPMRATTPPMIAGSTFVASVTVRPVSRRQAVARSPRARSVERRRRRDFRADDVPVSRAADRGSDASRSGISTRRSRSASSVSSLPRSATNFALREQVGDGGALARHRHRRVQEHLLEQRVLLEEIGELRQVVLDLLEIRLLLDGDVEEGAGVADGGGLVGHEFGASVWSLRRVSQASPNLYHLKTICHKANSGAHDDLDAGRAAPTVPIRTAGTPAARKPRRPGRGSGARRN